MSKSIAHRVPAAGAMLLAALLAITFSMAACEDDAQTVRDANESAATSMPEPTPTPTPEPTATPTPSAEIQVTELEKGDCVNSTIPEGISIDTVVIVPCAGEWQYKVLNAFAVADAEDYPGEEVFVEQVAGNCDRQTSSYLRPTADSWEGGDRTVTCLQQAPDLFISDLLQGIGLNPEELTESQRSCLHEWVAGANLVTSHSAPETLAEDFLTNLANCAPDLLISNFVERLAAGVGVEWTASEEEQACLRERLSGEWWAEVLMGDPDENPATAAAYSRMLSCIPDLFAQSVEPTPTPEPTATPTSERAAESLFGDMLIFQDPSGYFEVEVPAWWVEEAPDPSLLQLFKASDAQGSSVVIQVTEFPGSMDEYAGLLEFTFIEQGVSGYVIQPVETPQGIPGLITESSMDGIATFAFAHLSDGGTLVLISYNFPSNQSDAGGELAYYSFGTFLTTS